MSDDDAGDVFEQLQIAQQALAAGDREGALRAARQAYEAAVAGGPIQALPDAAFLRGMATADPAERAAFLSEALTLLEAHGRTEDAESLRGMLSGAVVADARPAWADALETAVAARDLDGAFAVLAAARDEALEAARTNEVLVIDSVVDQLRGMAATSGDRERHAGEALEAYLDRLIQRVQFEAGAGDAENVRATCAALSAAGASASPGLRMQAVLVVVQALAHIGDRAAAQARFAECQALLPQVPGADGAVAQVGRMVQPPEA